MQSSMHSFNTCQKAMVLSPTKACRPELRLFVVCAKLEMQSRMHASLTYVFFQAQVYAVLSSSLYKVLLFSHVIIILCIAHISQEFNSKQTQCFSKTSPQCRDMFLQSPDISELSVGMTFLIKIDISGLKRACVLSSVLTWSCDSA